MKLFEITLTGGSDLDWRIEDAGDLRKALEAAAPHIVRAVLAGYRERLVKEAETLAVIASTDFPPAQPEAIRLRGKAEGVRLAMSYLDEILRGIEVGS